MQGIHKVHAAAVLFVFIYGTASTHLWEDDEGTTHKIVQGEGGEQGDAMMPLLFSLVQLPALEAVQAPLIPGELLFAYLDDIYVVSSPEPCTRCSSPLSGGSQGFASTREKPRSGTGWE